jgi:hypothetical protein
MTSWLWRWLWQLLILKDFLALGAALDAIKLFIFSSLKKRGGFAEGGPKFGVFAIVVG